MKLQLTKKMRWTAAVVMGLVAGGVNISIAYGSEAKPVLPVFQVEPDFPSMPERILLAAVAGVATDSQDTVWAITRPHSVEGDFFMPQGYQAGPAVMSWDKSGKYLGGWGGPAPSGEYQWPSRGEMFLPLPPCKSCNEPRTVVSFVRVATGEHGIYIDHKNNVWITGNGAGDGQLMKFNRDGKFLLQIGHGGRKAQPLGMTGATTNSADTENLSGASTVAVYPKTNEVFVADGYGNRRVIVFDADSGKFKRMWGAYGEKPDDHAPNKRTASGPPPRQFDTVHGIAISDDGIVYVADRGNNRIQTFTPDGKFLQEGFNKRESPGVGTAASVALSRDPQQRFLYTIDSSNSNIAIMDRATLKVLGSIGRRGPKAGEFTQLHSLTVDARGNLITGEVSGRVQRFTYKGLSQ